MHARVGGAGVAGWGNGLAGEGMSYVTISGFDVSFGLCHFCERLLHFSVTILCVCDFKGSHLIS